VASYRQSRGEINRLEGAMSALHASPEARAGCAARINANKGTALILTTKTGGPTG